MVWFFVFLFEEIIVYIINCNKMRCRNVNNREIVWNFVWLSYSIVICFNKFFGIVVVEVIFVRCFRGKKVLIKIIFIKDLMINVCIIRL